METNSLKIQPTGFQKTLKSGSFVVFTVNKKIDLNIYQISLFGKFINVKSSNRLYPGSKIHAQIFWIKNKLQLKIFDQKNSTNLNIDNKSGFPDIKKRLISEGLIRTNMPFNPAYFDKILSVTKNYKKTGHKIIKILLLMIDKGIPLDDANIDEILRFSGYSDKDNSKNHKRKFQQKQNDNDSKESSKESIKEQIKNQIKKIDSGSELIKYFNHSIGKHDNWLIIPLSFDYIRTGHGVLKLKLNDEFLITNLVLTLEDGNDWEFNLMKSKNGGKMQISGPKNPLWKDSLSFIKLKEKLYNKGIIIDDINSNMNLTDGFTMIKSGNFDSINFIV